MRFVHLKQEVECKAGDGSILTGEEAVLVWLNRGGVLTFHPQCYLRWSQEQFLNQWEKWKAENPPRTRKYRKRNKVRGRPRKYSNFVKSQRLMCSIAYYRKKGNMEKVLGLEQELDKLRVDKK